MNKKVKKISNLPQVFVIVLNWNGKKYIKKCLDSLLKTNYPKLEVIVVDNASTDGSKEIVEKEYPEVILIENKENLGFCKGNNVGIKKASGDLIILLNNDVIVDRNWINEIIKVAKIPNVGIIGCKILYVGSKIIQSLGYKEKFLGYWENIGAGFCIDELKDKLIEVDYVMGAAIAIKRKVLNKIGLLDPRFFAFAEEVDLCYRAKKAGYKVVTSGAVVYHYGSGTWHNFPLKKLYLIYRNKILFISKNYPKIALLKYFFEYPLFFTKYSLTRFVKKETTTQILSKSKNYGTLRRLIKEYLFDIFFFYVTLVPGLRLIKNKSCEK